MRTWVGCFAGLTGSGVLALVLGCGGGGGSSVSGTAAPAITGVSVSPATATVTIGTTAQFTATVSGTGAYSNAVTWLVTGPASWTGGAGSITTGTTDTTVAVYESPYPAPATVTITASATGDASKTATATVTLAAPAAAAGPALTVDASNETHPISPLIYGMNAFGLDPTTAANANITVTRWGGDDTSRYNHQTNVTNSASDFYFENFAGAAEMLPNATGSTNFTDFIAANNSVGTMTLGTVPVQGWVSNSTPGACSFTETALPGQASYSGNCGNGMYPMGTNGCTQKAGCAITGSAATPSITSVAAPAPAPPAPSAATVAWAEGTWAGGWANSVVSAFGPGNPATGNGKGVAIWDLDNEPAWWDSVHRDVHPLPSTYDEVTQGGIGTALAIKTVDPTAEVSGPVIDYWWNYFYSKQDIENGWGAGPCYAPWSHPADRAAHGGVLMIEYYLQQFRAAETTYGRRLLDYLDIHGYFAPDYPAGSTQSVGLTTAGDSVEQEIRLNSTRALWDPTYTDPNDAQPNYTTDASYTSSCATPLQAPQVIPMLQSWVAKDYPGTKTAIDEYNFGGLESINGALTQADVLGIFGKYGLDLATLWPTTVWANQGPGNMAFALYRNYDGSKSTFGDMALASTSANQGHLAVYGALRSSDQAVTVVVINKTYSALTSTVSLENLAARGNAQVFQYSAANLAAIAALPGVSVTAPGQGSTTSAIAGYSFPAASITLFVIPTQ
ncbi:MAG TPA: glycoside hydrolase family 44 protein [Acidobacteriaceae bacterium]|nr:glycoside hydrolase family 44 protein [Acidobacteriaceae bacterium]